MIHRFGLIASTLILILILTLTACGSGGSHESSPVGDFKPATSNEKLVNGTIVNPDELQALRRLFVVLPGQAPIFACSGTFITPNHFLTAAHCVVQPDNTQIPAEFLYVEVESNVLAPAAGVASHPGYNPTAQYYAPEMGPGAVANPFDVGIVLTAYPYQGPVATVSTIPVSPGQGLILAGYGKFVSFMDSDQQLRLGNNNVLGVSYYFGTFAWDFTHFAESQICYGDSGGPVIAQFGGPEGPAAVVGINSTVSNECNVGGIGTATMLSSVIDFLIMITGGNFNVI